MNYLDLYANFLNKNLKPKDSVKAVFDCSNGSAGPIVKRLENNNLETAIINGKADGNFPAHGPNPMLDGAMEQLGDKVRALKADIGVAFDADADRAFFTDNTGAVIHPDAVLALLSKNFKGPVVLDPRCGYLVREILTQEKKEIINSRVGHYFIKKIIKEKKASFGGELSGHYYFKVRGAIFDSGILTAIYLINQVSKIKKAGSSLSDWLISLPKYYSSGEVNFEIANKNEVIRKMEDLYGNEAKSTSKLDGLKMEFNDWWFILRASQTENLLRLVMEAKNELVFNDKLKELRDRILLTNQIK